MFIEIQLNYLYWLQTIRTATEDILTPFFLFMTGMGEYMLPVLACAIIYWSVDKKLGALMLLSTGVTLMFNQLLKNIACIHRPWVLDSRIKPVEKALQYAGGYSFPSGHSSLAVSCWGAIGLWYKNNKKILISCILICLLVAFSRNYLGVHTLQDILFGLLTSFLLLIIVYKLLKWSETRKNGDVLLATIASLISIVITSYTCLKDYPISYDANGHLLVNPDKMRWEALPKLGLVLGSFWGWCFEKRLVNYDPDIQTFKEKVSCSTIGVLLLLIITKYILPLWKEHYGKNLGGFGFLLTVSLFITLIYPWTCKVICQKKGSSPKKRRAHKTKADKTI